MKEPSHSSQKMSRRQIVGTAAGSAAVSIALLSVPGVTLTAQAPPAVPDFDKAARESHRENSAVLAKFDIPMSLEPAFQFKA